MTFDGNYFHLGTLDIRERIRNEAFSESLMGSAKLAAQMLAKIPFIRLVCVTGAVSAGNAKENDDIDIMVVSSRGRLWLTRFLTVLLLKKKKMYRRDGDEKRKICPNIFIDEENLGWGGGSNIYTAHEIILAKPVFDRGGYYFKFLKANTWIKNHFANFVFGETPRIPARKPSAFMFYPVEKMLMLSQLLYMRRKKTTEVTTSKVIHFKRTDHTDAVIAAYYQRCKVLGI